MRYYFITGTSRGIGKALALELLKREDTVVYGLSRTQSIQHPRYHHTEIDLADTAAVEKYTFPRLHNPRVIALINNAGVIGHIKPAGKMQAESVDRVFKVNTIAPALLSNKFLADFPDDNTRRIILNVSSGAAKNPIDGWSAYCASKAALDMFSRTIAEEIKVNTRKHLFVFSIAPGVVDTAMQDHIRTVAPEDFSRVSQFVEYKTSNQLQHPDLISLKYMAILDEPEKFSETVFSLKDVSV